MTGTLPDFLIGLVLLLSVGAFTVLGVSGVLFMRAGERQARETAAEIEASEVAAGRIGRAA